MILFIGPALIVLYCIKPYNSVQTGHKYNTGIVFQSEEEAKLKEQITAVSKDLSSEKNRCAELQKTSDGTKESLAALQSDYYGKESELSAVRQDLKV